MRKNWSVFILGNFGTIDYLEMINYSSWLPIIQTIKRVNCRQAAGLWSVVPIVWLPYGVKWEFNELIKNDDASRNSSCPAARPVIRGWLLVREWTNRWVCVWVDEWVSGSPCMCTVWMILGSSGRRMGEWKGGQTCIQASKHTSGGGNEWTK